VPVRLELGQGICFVDCDGSQRIWKNRSLHTSWPNQRRFGFPVNRSPTRAINSPIKPIMMKIGAKSVKTKVPYDERGPNGNSAARELGRVGGFNPSRPPRAVGWDSPVPMR
jgi:hypothetical protein